MAELKIESKIVDVAEARELLASSVYARQRKLRAAHVQRLARIMNKGEFRQGTPIDLAVVGKRQYLLNGQHTLNAIIHSGEPQMLLVV
jgi:hypothetical protein